MIIIVAVIFSLFRFAIPYVTHYGDSIEAELSNQLGMTVRIEKVDADIRWLTPRLNLIGVTISEPDTQRIVLSVDEINLGLSWRQSFSQLRPELGFVSLVGLDLEAERQADGNIVVQGFAVQQSGSSSGEIPEQIFTFLESSSIYIVDSRLQWRDKQNNNQYLDFTNVNLALLNDAPGHSLSIDADLPDSYGHHLNLVFAIEGPLHKRESWKGKIFADVKGVRLKRWLDDYWQHVSFNGSGLVDAKIWLNWNEDIINMVDVQLGASELAINYLEQDVRSWRLQHFAGQFRWQLVNKGWQVDVRDLTMQRDGLSWPQTADAWFSVNDIDGYVDAQSSFVRIEDVAYLGGLVSRFVPLQNFDWNQMFDTYQPQGDLRQLSLHVPLATPRDATIRGRFSELGYQSDGVLPAASGLDGALSYDGNSTVLHLDSKQIEVDYPAVFRNKLKLKSAAGKLTLYRDQRLWQLSSDDLHIDTPHLVTRSRLNIQIPTQGPPFIDMVTRFKKGEASEKSRYLPAAIMPKATVEWLDRAIVNADITDGGFLFYGNTSDYPFDKGEGVMQVLFDVQHAKLQYLEDWPALDDLSAQLHFYNRRLTVTGGKGTIQGAPFFDTQLSIDDLHHATLDIMGKVSADLPRMQSFIAHSPLKKLLGDYLLNLQMQGKSNLDLGLVIPVNGDQPLTVKGDLQFIDDEIYFPEQGYKLTGIQGSLQFTEDKVSASQIKAKADDGELAIDIATLNEDNDALIRIAANGKLSAKTLLTPVPILVDHFSGNSHWNLQIDIPVNGVENPVQIAANSDLLGTASSLPGCYGKTAEQSGAFNFDLAVKSGGDLDIGVQLDQMYEVQASSEQKKWSLDVRSRDVVGHARFSENFQLDKPVVIYADYLNAGSLLASEDSDEPSQEKFVDLRPQNIPSLRVQIGKLEWGDYHFSDLNLETQRNQDRMHITHFEFHAPTVTVMGQGNWSSDWRKEQLTSLDFTLDSHNLGSTLKQFKITEAIEKTNGVITAHWDWSGRPDQFHWDHIRGHARVDLKDGAFRDIDVGAGRLIGILNFETLLSLDFGNQVAKGFAFDSLQGDLRFDAGNAYTRDLTIESKVAEIVLDGRIGLSAQDYDQTITVIPGVGSTLTVIGAVAGGPVTAAAVHLFRKMFGLDRIAEYKYSVTGSWEEPKVELLSAPKNETDTDIEQDSSNYDGL